MAKEISYKIVKVPIKLKLPWKTIIPFVLIGSFILFYFLMGSLPHVGGGTSLSGYAISGSNTSRLNQSNFKIADIKFIIPITNAWQLDSSRSVIGDIFKYVNRTDNLSYTIPQNGYIRTIFEQNLSKNNTINVYTKNPSNEPATIEIYEKNSNILVGEIKNVTTGVYNINPNISGEADTFDFKSVGNPVTYDFIQDKASKTLASVALTTSPDASAGLSIVEGNTFTMTCTENCTGNGGTPTITDSFQYTTTAGCGSGDTNIPTSGAILTTPTNPGTGTCGADSVTVTGSQLGTVYIQCYSDDTTNSVTATSPECWQITVTAPPSNLRVNLNSPVDAYNSSSSSIDFSGTPITYQYSLANVSIYANISGSWTVTQTNSSPINNTPTTFAVTGISDGIYKWNYQACDSNGVCNFSSSNRTFKVDTTGPSLSNPYSNVTNVTKDQYFCLNITASDALSGVDTVYAEVWNTTAFSNYTMVDDGTTGCDGSAGDGVYGVDIKGTAVGLWNYSEVYANDTLNNWNSDNFPDITINVTAIPDTTYPQFTNFLESPSNSSAYSFGQSYSINSTTTNTNGTVGLEFNGVNYTASNDTFSNFYVNLPSLAAGTYNYYWWGYGNGTNNNYNQSNMRVYVVQKATPLGSLTNNVSWTVTYPTTVAIGYTESNNGDSDVTYNVYRDGVNKGSGETATLGANTYNYVLNTTGGTNYSSTSSMDSQTLTVNKNTGSCNVLFNETSPTTYPSSFKVWSNCNSAFTLYRNGTSITNNSIQNLGAGAWNFTVVRTDNVNYTNTHNTQIFTINKNAGSCGILLNTSNTITYGDAVNIRTNCTSSYSMYLNGTTILNNTNYSLGAGYYNFSVFRTDNQNYTNVHDEVDLTVNKATPILNYYLNGATSNLTVNYPTEINASANTNFGTLNIYRNGTDITSLNNLNESLNAGYYEYVFNVTGSANYSGVPSKYLYATVNKNPSSCNVLFNETSPLTYSSLFKVWSDCNSAFTLYRNGTSISNNSVQNLAAGTWNFTVVRIDQTNYSNYYNEQEFTMNKAAGSVAAYINNVRSNQSILLNNEKWLNATLLTGVGNIKLYYNNTLINQGASPLSNLTNFTSVGTWNVSAVYDGNENYTSSIETWWAIVNADSPPKVLIEYPTNTNYNTDVTQLNYTATDTDPSPVSSCWYSLNGGAVNSTPDPTCSNFTGLTSNQGNNTWTVYANDTISQIGSSSVTFFKDTINPSIAGIVENPSSPATYSPSQSYQFNATVTDTNLNDVLFDFNNVNYTPSSFAGNIYSVTLPDLTAGTYNYYWFANDSVGNINTSSGTYTVNKNPSSCNVLFNETSPTTYPSSFKVWSNCNSAFTLYRNGTSITNNSIQNLGAGAWNFTVVRTDNVNYTNTHNTQIFTINKNPEVTYVLFNATSPAAYPTSFKAWSNATSAFTLYRNGTLISNNSVQNLAAGTWNFTVVRTDTANYTNTTATRFFTINKLSGAVTLLINNSASNQNAVYGTQTNVSASTPYGTTTLLRNGTDVSTENNVFKVLGVGYYNYTASSSGDENHSSASTSLFVSISQAQSSINLTLNGTEGNVTITQDSTIPINLTTISGDSGAALKLYDDNTLINQGTNPLGNLTAFHTIGVFNITGYYLTSQNYTGSSETWYVNVTPTPDLTPPTISSLTENPLNPATYSPSQLYQFNATVTDNRNVSSVWINFNGVNHTVPNVQGNIYSFAATDLAAGSYPYRWYANDTSGNLNETSLETYTINKAVPSLSLTFSPSNSESYGTQTTATGANCSSQLTCNLYRNSNLVLNPDTETLAAGTYSYVYNTTGNANYTSYTNSSNLVINKNPSSCNVLFNETSPVTYGTSVRVFTNCGSSFTLYRNGTSITNNSVQNLGAGAWNFTVIRTDDVNYTNTYDEQNFIVNKAAGVVYTYLNNSRSNLTMEQFNTIYLNGTLEVGQAGATIKLYNNGTLINQGTSPLSNFTNFTNTGLYNITTIYDGNANYTAAHETFFLTVIKKDVTPPNLSIIYPQNTSYNYLPTQLNFSAVDNVEVNSCWYSLNGGATNSTHETAVGGFCSNFTGLTSNQGNNTWTVYANDEKDNLNSSSVTFFVDSIKPTISYATGTDTSGTTLGRNYIQVNVTASDTNLNKITIRLYNSTSLVQTDTSSSNSLFMNYTNLPAGTYYFNATATDTVGNSANLETKNITLSKPTISIIKPENGTYITNTNLPLKYYTNYSGNVWYSLDQIKNTTLAGNTTFNATEGGHVLRLYANNTLGTTEKDITFTVNLTKLKIDYRSYSGNASGNSTNFNDSSYGELQNLSNVILENINYGKINFNEPINVTADADLNNTLNISKYVNISSNKISINSSALPDFNKSATLYLYGLTFSNPLILMDGSPCPDTICQKISYSSSTGTLEFNVTHFTTYSAEETPSNQNTGSGATAQASPQGTYECTDNSQCTDGNQCFNHLCVKLFDIKILSFPSPVNLGSFFNFTYFLKGAGNIDSDVKIDFWIENSTGGKVTSGSDVIYFGNFENETESTQLFLPNTIKSGIYRFVINVSYGAYSAESYRTIEVEVKNGTATITSPWGIKNLIIISISLFAALLLTFVVYKRRRGIEYFLMKILRKIAIAIGKLSEGISKIYESSRKKLRSQLKRAKERKTENIPVKNARLITKNKLDKILDKMGKEKMTTRNRLYEILDEMEKKTHSMAIMTKDKIYHIFNRIEKWNPERKMPKEKLDNILDQMEKGNKKKKRKIKDKLYTKEDLDKILEQMEKHNSDAINAVNKTDKKFYKSYFS